MVMLPSGPHFGTPLSQPLTAAHIDRFNYLRSLLEKTAADGILPLTN